MNAPTNPTSGQPRHIRGTVPRKASFTGTVGPSLPLAWFGRAVN